MSERVEYCIANVEPSTRERLVATDRAREKPCLQRCGACDEGPILVVGGDLVTAPSHDDLLCGVDE